ncbi:hypothetical protein BRC81_02355 [Halobacteriales archaeon QS_1_68_20]|nr:MAG: hypothetical protein BRC81_02355 [Halobacteriales archaeon QS_1_68_20]
MRRDYFSLDVRDVDWVEDGGTPAKPKVTIDFEGPAATLRERLSGPDGQMLDDDETDVAFRLQSSIEDPDATGVVSVTNRVTGDFVLELNQDASDVIKFIRAAREYGKHADDEGHYSATINVDGEAVATYEKRTFLVYDSEGNLLRQHSLIPSGVEL